MGVIDISSAYKHSGPIERNIYVRLPREWHGTKRGYAWQLLKMPFGASETGRQWAKLIEKWLTEVIGFEQMKGIAQIIMKMATDGKINMILTKFTDDLLLEADTEKMTYFTDKIYKRFKVSNALIDEPINFDVCRIEQDDHGNIKMGMHACMQSIK